MRSLPETALEFARECLGWTNATPAGEIPAIRSAKPYQSADYFRYTDLNEVLHAAKNWCLSQEPRLCAELGFNCNAEVSTFEAVIRDFDDEAIASVRFKSSAAEAIIAACLDAAARVKNEPA